MTAWASHYDRNSNILPIGETMRRITLGEARRLALDSVRRIEEERTQGALSEDDGHFHDSWRLVLRQWGRLAFDIMAFVGALAVAAALIAVVYAICTGRFR